jgi:hypothetical protein
VAVFAIDRRMPAEQGEICIGVIEIRGYALYFETLFIVAGFTFPAEFTLVYVFVAGNTVGIFDTNPVLEYFSDRNIQIMAVFATDCLVLACKRKPRFAVIELAVQHLKPLLCVTFLAIVTQFVSVNVLVATAAVDKGYTGETLKFRIVSGLFRVALNASHVFVLARQRIMRLFVPELRCRREIICSVTLSTVNGEGALVYILVTILAVFAEPQKCFRSFFDILVLNQIGLVAFAAINGFVFACQFEACREVIESFLIKSDHVEVPSVVITVAVGALFAARFLRGVETPVPVDEILNVLMTGKAFVVGNFGAYIVAFRAVEHTLKRSMTPGELTGRQLSPQTDSLQHCCKKYQGFNGRFPQTHD